VRRGCSNQFTGLFGLRASRSQFFVYDVPSKFTSDLLDVEVDVRQTPMDELERRALGAEIVFHKFLLDDVSGTSALSETCARMDTGLGDGSTGCFAVRALKTPHHASGREHD
jgi:hypothetical protein